MSERTDLRPTESSMATYRTLVADPPWDVRTGPAGGGMGEGFVGGNGRNRPLAYPTMSLEDIKALPVTGLALDDAHLFLWTINKYVEDAYDVARAWGFRPSTLLTWCKAPMGGGLGGVFGISSEYILYCRRGKPENKARHRFTWFDWKRPYNAAGKPDHSHKPDGLLDVVEWTCPGPYLELFARRNRLGWDTWGDQALEHVEVAPC